MGYYVRVLTPEDRPIAPWILTEAVARFGCRTSGDTHSGEWGVIEALSRSGETLCIVERNPVVTGSVGEDEIGGFQEEIAECLPKAASEWLRTYLTKVRTIYAIQIFDEVYSDDGWAAVHAMQGAIWSATGGIFQADGEGFSNEDGDHILWQFSDRVEGEWWAAVLKAGTWERFRMDLGNEAHRCAFKSGEVPTDAERAR